MSEKTRKIIRTPRQPTKAERERHNESHWPFAPWCKHCVRGRGIDSKHALKDEVRNPHAVPTVAMDYCFPCGSPDKTAGEESFIVLVVKEDKSGAVMTMVVPKKGTSYKCVVDKTQQWIDELGHPKVILKCDKEPSMLQLQNEIRERRQDRIVIPENSPTGESRSNGMIENAVQEVEGFIRTLKDSLEATMGIELNASSPAMAWLVRHVGTILTRVKMKMGPQPMES
jgi:hypothetical protein